MITNALNISIIAVRLYIKAIFIHLSLLLNFDISRAFEGELSIGPDTLCSGSAKKSLGVREPHASWCS